MMANATQEAVTLSAEYAGLLRSAGDELEQLSGVIPQLAGSGDTDLVLRGIAIRMAALGVLISCAMEPRRALPETEALDLVYGQAWSRRG